MDQDDFISLMKELGLISRDKSQSSRSHDESQLSQPRQSADVEHKLVEVEQSKIKSGSNQINPIVEVQ